MVPCRVVATEPAEPTKVLIVDDDALLIDVLAELLSAAGVDVSVAATYEEAISHIEQAEQLDLVLSDMDLRGPHSGIDVIGQLRAKRPEVRGMLISGHPRSYLETVDPRISDIELLPKPFRVDQVLDRIANSPGVDRGAD